MNRSVKTYVPAINEMFYKNVFLLTQLVPPSAELQRHFKQGMFDKPNTEGFLHVSHYLSGIYDEDLFKRMVMWPILCKMDIMTYRTEIKNFFSILSQDNPDINFPPILMSHLIHSGGTKFLIIMWKLSQLALRAYIKKESQTELLSIPGVSPTNDMSVTYLNNTIAEKSSVAIEAHGKARRILDTAVNFLNDEIEISNKYKSEIFDRKENIKRLAQVAPVHPLLQEQLMDIEDINIINEWRRNIWEGVLYVRKKNEELNELRISCSCLCKLVLRMNSNFKILDVDEFPKYNNYNFLLRTEPKLTYNLYTNGSIAFQALLSLLRLASIQMLHHVNDAVSSYDLSQCLPFIQNAHEDIKSLQTMFTALDVRVTGIFTDEHHASGRNKSMRVNFNMDSALVMRKNMLLQSPKISFNFEQYADNNHLFKMLGSPLTKDRHKNLFKRYKRKYRPSYDSLISFNTSMWNSMNKRPSPYMHFSRHEQTTSGGKSIPLLYSRLLRQPTLKSKYPRDSTLSSPTLNQGGTNKRRRSMLEDVISNNHSGRIRNLFNSTATSSHSYTPG